MYSDQWLGLPSALDIQPTKEEKIAKQQLDSLIAVGLISPDAARRSKKIAPSQRDQGHKELQVSLSSAASARSGSNTPQQRANSSASRQQDLKGDRPLLSSLAQLKSHRNSMFAAKGASRRERTFIGSVCAACEEPLEHTLRGEHILQLSCGHVAHEACFYEFIKEFQAQECPTCNAPLGLDTSRGGGIDFEQLNKLVRSAKAPDVKERFNENQHTSAPWESNSVHRSQHQQQHPPQHQHQQQQYQQPQHQQQQQHQPQHQQQQQHQPQQQQQQYHAQQQASQAHQQSPRRHPRMSRDHLLPEQVRMNSYQFERTAHGRNESADTGAVSAGDYSDTQNTTGRKHDYDVQSMETSLSTPRHMARNPIPAPTVTVRSEFPTLSKSRQQQSLTCLVTVEVVDGKWQPNPEDFRSPPPIPATIPEEGFEPPKNQSKSHPSSQRRAADSVHEDAAALEEVKDELYRRCENWHGLDFQRFGQLLRYGNVRVGKDKQAWQELECYLFTEMLICVKAKKVPLTASQQWDGPEGPSKKASRVTLKGSILIKRHLKEVEVVRDYEILTLSLSVAELPHFHLQFQEHAQLEVWRKSLLSLNSSQHVPEPHSAEYQDTPEEDDYGTNASKGGKRVSSLHSSTYGAGRSQATAPTEYTNSRAGVQDMRLGTSSLHVPIDMVIVIPVSSSMAGLKINVLRDTLRFLVSSLGERDRMGLVSFGSGGGGVPLVGMTNKTWSGWAKAIDSIRPMGQKSMRADVVEGANVAVDLLMQRKSSNALSSILLISDSATSDHESVDFVVSRAEAAKISIHSFGLGLTHKPDTMVDLSTRTKASYTYVKDWMMLRECVAGCVGALQSTSHQNVKLKLRLPEGSPAKFVKISGALQITKRATGRDAEASLGDLRFGDKRDILVQLAIAPDTATPDSVPTDPWENIISGLEALGGPLEHDESRTVSVEELPLIQADLAWGDILREGNAAHLPRPSLLAITMLPSSAKRNQNARPATPPIPPHPHIVQRRMELLTSDMFSRALFLVSRNQPDRAHHLLTETRSILKGLGKGGLPPLPPPPNSALPPTPKTGNPLDTASSMHSDRGQRTPSPPRSIDVPSPFNPTAGIESSVMMALDSELEASLEWISHPAVFGRDSRKAVLQAIGVISSQRGFTFRTPSESLWATRISGVRRLSERSRDWREAGDESLMEET